MIIAQEPRHILWQSADGLMEAGTAQTRSQHAYYYASLGARPVALSDIEALIEFLEKATPVTPLLLLSCCPGFQANPEEEQKGLVFYAGHYRALQQSRKQAGGLIISYLYQVAVGGTYLMHGLSAQHRAASEDTVFYDTVPSRPPVPLIAAQNRGLIDTIVPEGQFLQWLEKALNETPLPA